MKYLLLAGCLLGALPGRAQLITDPARALAARDTLFHEAELLRQSIQQRTPLFQAAPRNRFARRVVIKGAELPPPGGTAPYVNISWRQVTRYRRNGRVQQTFLARQGSRVVLEEQRLNGRVLWLWLRPVVGGTGTASRILGRYYDSGYLQLNRTEYALPPAR